MEVFKLAASEPWSGSVKQNEAILKQNAELREKLSESEKKHKGTWELLGKEIDKRTGCLDEILKLQIKLKKAKECLSSCHQLLMLPHQIKTHDGLIGVCNSADIRISDTLKEIGDV